MRLFRGTRVRRCGKVSSVLSRDVRIWLEGIHVLGGRGEASEYSQGIGVVLHIVSRTARVVGGRGGDDKQSGDIVVRVDMC